MVLHCRLSGRQRRQNTKKVFWSTKNNKEKLIAAEQLLPEVSSGLVFANGSDDTLQPLLEAALRQREVCASSDFTFRKRKKSTEAIISK
jgi:hypothetical protein